MREKTMQTPRSAKKHGEGFLQTPKQIFPYMVRTMVRQVVPLQPVEVNSGADSPLQPLEDPMLKQASGRTCSLVGDPSWISLFLKDCIPWKGPTAAFW